MDSPEWHSAASDPRGFVGVDLGQSRDPTAICDGASYRTAGARPGGCSETTAVRRARFARVGGGAAAEPPDETSRENAYTRGCPLCAHIAAVVRKPNHKIVPRQGPRLRNSAEPLPRLGSCQAPVIITAIDIVRVELMLRRHKV